jgi:hypothetical protein
MLHITAPRSVFLATLSLVLACAQGDTGTGGGISSGDTDSSSSSITSSSSGDTSDTTSTSMGGTTNTGMGGTPNTTNTTNSTVTAGGNNEGGATSSNVVTANNANNAATTSSSSGAMCDQFTCLIVCLQGPQGACDEAACMCDSLISSVSSGLAGGFPSSAAGLAGFAP